MQRLVRDLNRLLRAQPALHRLDAEAAGFEWVDAHDAERSIFAWLRFDEQRRPLLVICHFTPVHRPGLRFGVPEGIAHWREVLNTDHADYGGGGIGNPGLRAVDNVAAHGRAQSLCLDLPPMATILLAPA